MSTAPTDTPDPTAHMLPRPSISPAPQPPFPKTAPYKSPPAPPVQLPDLSNDAPVDWLFDSTLHRSVAPPYRPPPPHPERVPPALQTIHGCIARPHPPPACY